MKTLYLIGGTMGVGKTSVSQELKRLLPRSVFLDGDWCWDAHPFLVTDETKKMVMDNICHLLNNFLHCSAYEHIIFCWVMHEQQIIDDILSRLDTTDCRIRCISLVCDEAALTKRLQKDIDAGVRTPDVIKRSVARMPLYAALDTEKMDTTGLSAKETAKRVCKN
ncbi:MAG: AAA family ATPase [Clostridia bacterium]|nr:AAA family ATPase [Clostridia bacterium]MBR6787859.1 AAA family ATPase [Clostridia bacterium]